MNEGDKSSRKILERKYNCTHCDYNTCKISNYSKHLLTAKHLTATNGDNKVAKSSLNNFVCICGNIYKHRQGLNRHKNKCTYEENPAPEMVTPDPNSKVDLLPDNLVVGIHMSPDQPNNNINISMMIDIIKENQEIKNLLIEQNKQVIELHKENNILINKLVEREPGNINSNNTTNNINQKFNLNFFLNETCKDALNINEFLDNIQITFQDLMQIGDVGFVAGVSDIFIRQLHNLEISKRPLHCTDLKRETIYFKQDNMWNKDNTDNSKLKNIIEKIEYRNVVALRDWCNENPDAKVNNTDNNLLKDKIYLQTLQGDERTREKIIKNISKEIIIDKE